MVTLENILEELVGQIQDEFDQEKPLLARISETTWDVAGALPLHDLEEIIGEPLREEGITNVWETVYGQTRLTEELNINRAQGRITHRTRGLDGSTATRTWLHGQAESLLAADGTGAPLRSVSYTLDAHGRIGTESDARNGATDFGYNSADEVTQVTGPAPASGVARPTRSFGYNNIGWVTNVVEADGNAIGYQYLTNGLVHQVSGIRMYPVQYGYDAQGRLKTITTWHDYAGNSGAAVTTFNYYGETGLLQNKQYGNSAGPSYGYTAGGRLQTRNWQRGVTT